ncbi:hypothetical protein [Ahrensia kielensis]|uniref:hypothetical protein n=1 Tax=Ahrensia kielensis TaxID=76980 RepID=UPI0004782D97|nr:hypothetical protein [Ahrensia kielensis]
MRNGARAGEIRSQMTNVGAMTHFALAILALASGVYTYLGVRSLLDGSASQIFFAAIVYASAVSVGIYVFWAYLMRFFPLIIERSGRLALIGVMIVGGGMIIAMSSWLNAAALAGSAALEQHLAVTLEEYAGDLDAAHGRALSAESLLPDVQRASERFSRLAEDERSNGALTGTSGSGSVVQLLGQMGAQLDELGDAIRNSRTQTETLFEKGRAHLSAMRTLVSAPGPVQPRADRYAEEAVTLSGVIAALQETSIAPSVKRAAEDLSIGFIAPIADGLDANLAARQSQIMATVESSVEAQSQALAQAADEIMAEPRVASRRFQPLSSAEAVIRYASDFAPSWAGAISIDLLPAMLVFMLAIAQSVSMREGAIQADAEIMSAADMMRALAVYREMSSLENQADANLEVTKSAPDEPPAEQDEPVLKNSVTPISSIVKK